MITPEQRLEKVKEFLQLLKGDDTATKSDIAQIFTAVIAHFRSTRGDVQKDLEDHKDQVREQVGVVRRTVWKLRDSLGSYATKDDIAKAQAFADSQARALHQRVGTVAASIPEATDLSEIEERLELLETPKEEKAEKPDLTAEQIRDSLETLEGDDRLDVSAIKGLDEWEKRVTDSARQASGLIVAQQRGQVKYYDLSPFLDGSTTTFALPAFARILLITGTSDPIVFRQGVDYTVDAFGMKVSFTNQIVAAAALAAGQTVTIIYAEN